MSLLVETILSVESQLSSIEEQFLDAYDKVNYLYIHSSYLKLKDVPKALKSVLAFQRKIELLYSDIKKLKDEKTFVYIKRCGRNVKLIENYLRGSSNYIGVCNEINDFKFEEGYKTFQKTRTLMYEICEDVRLIYALRIYSVEEKMALKSALTDYGFYDVTKCLEEAESNLALKHFKDCIDRCREALEKTVASLLDILDKKPSGYFSTDIGTFSNLRIISKEQKKLTKATYSYLSEVGAHGRGGDLTITEAHFSMKETYMRIDILLGKYAEYLALKRKT